MRIDGRFVFGTVPVGFVVSHFNECLSRIRADRGRKEVVIASDHGLENHLESPEIVAADETGRLYGFSSGGDAFFPDSDSLGAFLR